MNENPKASADARALLDMSALRVARHGLMITTGPNDGARLLFANAHFESLTGYRSPEIAGGDPLFFLVPNEDERERDLLRKAFASGHPARAIVRGVDKAGRTLSFALEVDPIRDAFGGVTHFVVTIEDIGRFRRA